MESNLKSGWLATYDPIYLGWNRWGILNGLCMTSGFFYPRTSGGYNLYRRVGGIPEPGSEPVGAAGSDATTVQTFPWVSHEAGREYTYRLVPVGGGGVENWTDITAVRVAFDENVDWNGPVPNAPSDLQLVPMAGGGFAVKWTYLPQDQGVEPAGFWLYTNWGGGEVDYGGNWATVVYVPGKIHYEYMARPRPHGERVGWGVRAFSASSREELNTNQVYGVARSEAPAINPVVMVDVVEPEASA